MSVRISEFRETPNTALSAFTYFDATKVLRHRNIVHFTGAVHRLKQTQNMAFELPIVFLLRNNAGTLLEFPGIESAQD